MQVAEKFDEFLTTKEAAHFLRIRPNTLRFLTSSRLLTFFKPHGKNLYFRKADLVVFMEKGKIANTKGQR